MKKRLTRDQEIELMLDAPARMQGLMTKWLSNAEVAQTITRLSVPRRKSGADSFVTERKVRRLRCA